MAYPNRWFGWFWWSKSRDQPDDEEKVSPEEKNQGGLDETHQFCLAEEPLVKPAEKVIPANNTLVEPAGEPLVASQRKGNYIAVAAVDFGTSYSGYAFSFRTEPDKIYTNTWYVSRQGSSQKAPSSVLFNKKQEFIAFGFEAEEKYAIHCERQTQKEVYFFRNFKMALYNRKVIKKTTTIADELGRTFPLLYVVKESIKYLKEHLFKRVSSNITGIKESDIIWILTVPAIWSDSAKYFMREAAEAAGIQKDLLCLCLEPEAAAMHCKSVPCNTNSKDPLMRFEPGEKYLVLDAGGGTVDIVVHEIDKNRKIKEIQPACGGDWGGTKVDKAIIDFLDKHLGQNKMSAYQRNENEDYLDFLREFEVHKRLFSTQLQTDRPIRLRIPSSLRDLLSTQDSPDCSADISLARDKLCICCDTMMSFFNDSKISIGNFLSTLFADDSLRNVSTIIMVGGYSDSEVLQAYIKETFPNKTVIIPAEAGLAVLKGAVLFGHDTGSIIERRSRYTYGIKCDQIFDISKHDISSKYIDVCGIARANDCFGIHVTVGQNLKVGKFQKAKTYLPSTVEEKTAVYCLYVCPRVNPVHVSEDDCFMIGKLIVDLSDLSGSVNDRRILVSLCFSGTEIIIQAKKKQTGEELSASIQYDW